MWRTIAVGGVSAGVLALWTSQKCATRSTFCSSTQSGTEESASGTTTLFNMPPPKTEAITESRKLIRRSMIEQGIPGGVICVTVDGKKVWSEGFGYADVENDVPCSSQTVMRIASISKCLTAVAAMQLWEDGLLDLDARVQTYVPEFPHKICDGKEVTITCRQLLCHTAGVRHYKKAADVKKNKGEFENDEYFIKDHYGSVSESLKLFSSDDLLYPPGTRFYYTTHGWTLLSAAIEGVSGIPFLDYLQKYILSPLNMDDTGPEKNNPLLYNRARYYSRNSSGILENTPYVDISYKWAGGGLYSSASDLCKLGCALLLSYQSKEITSLPSLRAHLEMKEKHVGLGTSYEGEFMEPFLLKPETIKYMWSEIVTDARFSSNPRLGYGLGWVVQREGTLVKGGVVEPFCVGHTGAAVGASSVLIVLPGKSCKDNRPIDCLLSNNEATVSVSGTNPRGVVVSILFNLQEVRGMFLLGSKIARLFDSHFTR